MTDDSEITKEEIDRFIYELDCLNKALCRDPAERVFEIEGFWIAKALSLAFIRVGWIVTLQGAPNERFAVLRFSSQFKPWTPNEKPEKCNMPWPEHALKPNNDERAND